ncbi:MAG: tRNA (adenosine(37)-N6)-threonylcarbamoyltransferase complex ATPase subunit type 1 TsaE [Bdellovibrionota bacterium]
MKQVYSENIKSVNELPVLVEKLSKLIAPGSIVLLSGDLAAGKTTFVAYFCKYFKITSVQSPTYALHQRYTNNNIVIDHFDLYRLETEDEVESSGFYDLLNTPADYKFIEWPERVNLSDFPLGKSLYKIVIKVLDGDIRQLELYKIS